MPIFKGLEKKREVKNWGLKKVLDIFQNTGVALILFFLINNTCIQFNVNYTFYEKLMKAVDKSSED